MNSKCPPRGFTLLESMLTVLLVMLVFGLVADLLHGSYQVMRVQRQRIEAAEAGQLALTRMINEIREASRVDVSSSPPELILFKVDPGRKNDLRTESNRFRYMLKVRYSLDNGASLLREVEDLSDSRRAVHLVADNIKGLQVEKATDSDNLVVTLTVDVRGVLRRISSEVTPLAVIPPP